MRLNQVSLAARNIAVSIAFYERLGLQLIFRTASYARFEVPDGLATLSLHLEEYAPAVSYIYFECDDLDAQVKRLKERGVVFISGPEDKRWLWREAWIEDPAGNQICLYFAGKNRRFPPWRIEAGAADDAERHFDSKRELQGR